MKKYYVKTKSTSYDESTGISKAWIATDLGDFFGEAILSPEDKDIASSFAGCEYAEIRAILKYAKLKIRILKYQLEPLLRTKKNYEKTNFSKRCSIPNPAIIMIDKEIERLQDILSTITSNMNNLQSKLDTDINTRREIVEHILKKKEQKQGNN